jgi:hypothetical protein
LTLQRLKARWILGLATYLKISYQDEEIFAMQYQVFIQSQSKQNFIASVVGMPNLTVEGRTEEEVIALAKAALES